jgi:hypothetical protein
MINARGNKSVRDRKVKGHEKKCSIASFPRFSG